MVEAPESRRAPGGSVLWPLVSLALLAAGWLVFRLTTAYEDRLRDQWGPAPDICDALGRDAYNNNCIWWYILLVVGLDGAAAVTLSVRARWGWPLATKVFVALLLVPSALLHGLALLVCGLFAA